MKKISLLDCTLRDGGYINNWKFGNRTVRDILNRLAASHVEYAECGYLSEFKGGDPDSTQFKDLDSISAVLPKDYKDTKFAVMIDFGQYRISNLTDASMDSPLLRVCFHKSDCDAALAYCEDLISKGYTVFLQPMASLNYTEDEFISLIGRVNRMHPACFYIVDSFGVMEIDDFQKLLSITEENLNSDILIGYHSHNNLQQAYGNAKYMVEQDLTHDLIIDSSVYGMGRGAGNLNTELFAAFLNRKYGKSYDIDCFLDIIDSHLKRIFAENYWGYSLPFYLSAQFNCHPNYAAYYSEKNTLSNRSMKQLLSSLPDDVKIRFSADLAEEYYQAFQQHLIDDSDAIERIKVKVTGRDVLILAPGKSIRDCKNEIDSYISANDPVVFAVNILPTDYSCDYVFCANEKRYQSLKDLPENTSLILSSNLDRSDNRATYINYSSYLTGNGMIADNPVLMLFRILSSIGVNKVTVAGFDGYSTTASENYYDESLSMGSSLSTKLEKNALVRDAVQDLRQTISIYFLTRSLYEQ